VGKKIGFFLFWKNFFSTPVDQGNLLLNTNQQQAVVMLHSAQQYKK